MIKFNNIWKTYSKELFVSKNTALQGLSFSLKKGNTLGLIGANGAGKSTSIRLLMDFIRPDKGNITISDHQPNRFSIRKHIGYLPETASFPPNLNIVNLLGFTGTTCNIPRKILRLRSEELLNKLDLWETRNRPLRTYSKGMQQRANFVLALINNPELLILDEPMSGLDPMGRNKIILLIQQLKQAGKTILFCSHILEDVDRLVDDILVLHKGKKLFYGTPAALTDQERKSSMAEAFVSMVQKDECND
ncbi:MAG: ABC transporter ATP-binding protein [Desulfobacterium sp.]|nr:ABC transporter ATP-binding protein [Desulfobacterium sp.]